MKSAILDAAGEATQTASTLIPPRSDKYFGWTNQEGEPATIKIERIVMMFSTNIRGRYGVIVEGIAQPINLDADHALRLLKILGWKGTALDAIA